MDQIQSVTAELRLQHWAKIIAECQASTQTVKAWCEANDIHIKTYYYWLRKLRQRTLESIPSCQSSQDDHSCFAYPDHSGERRRSFAARLFFPLQL